MAQLANVRAEALSAVSSSDDDIAALQTSVAQTLTDANAYTDTEIASLVNGASDALDTLKELGDALASGDNDLATQISTQVGNLDSKFTVSISSINTQISENDTDIGLLQTRATSLETRATALETKDTSLDSDISTLTTNLATLQNEHNTLLAAHQSLLSAHNALEVRLSNMEANAYAPWSPSSYAEVGYVYP